MREKVGNVAEFCLKCFNKMNHTHYTEKDVWLEEDLCEGCAEWKPCVMQLYPKPWFWKIVDFIADKVRR